MDRAVEVLTASMLAAALVCVTVLAVAVTVFAVAAVVQVL